MCCLSAPFLLYKEWQCVCVCVWTVRPWASQPTCWRHQHQLKWTQTGFTVWWRSRGLVCRYTHKNTTSTTGVDKHGKDMLYLWCVLILWLRKVWYKTGENIIDTKRLSIVPSPNFISFLRQGQMYKLREWVAAFYNRFCITVILSAM